MKRLDGCRHGSKGDGPMDPEASSGVTGRTSRAGEPAAKASGSGSGPSWTPDEPGTEDSVSGKPIEILYVEDNPADVRLTVEALKEHKVRNRLTVVPDGEQAMQFLHRAGRYAHATRPDLILLDLNLPRMDGREVLGEVKADPDLRRIPVVVITSSQAEQDIVRTYDLHANCYVTKPVDLSRFLDVVKSIEGFWLSVVTLPPKG
jgi:CheY-like chemotaxis protein